MFWQTRTVHFATVDTGESNTEILPIFPCQCLALLGAKQDLEAHGRQKVRAGMR